MTISKYFNVKSGIFDSKKEKTRLLELLQLEKDGSISNISQQKTFLLVPTFKGNDGKLERQITYKADFCYQDNLKNIFVVEDVKSEFTSKFPVYIIKRKLFKNKYPEIFFYENIMGKNKIGKKECD